MIENSGFRPRTPVRRRRIELRDMSCCLHEWGEASSPPLLLLHGWGDTGATFQFLVDELQEAWHVIAPDWRGFGESSHNRGSYWFPDYLADLDRLLATLELEAPVALVGHSMGGNVAALFAGIFPERVAALVNLEGYGLADSDPEDAPARYRRWIEAARDRAAPRRFASVDELAERLQARSPGLSRARAEWVAAQWAAPQEDGTLRVRADRAQRWPNPVLYRRREAEACWRRIVAPTLLVSGSVSEFGGAADWGVQAADARPVEIRVLDGAGHLLHFDAPAVLARQIEDFLARHGYPGTTL